VGSGCAANHFKSLPDKQEFNKPLSELKQQYNELSCYEPGPWYDIANFQKSPFGHADKPPRPMQYFIPGIWDYPYAEDLVAKWGEPDKTTWSWWNLMPGCFIPPFNPMARWYWYMDGKEVDVLIDRPIAYGYKPHVVTLEVIEKGKNTPE